MSPKSLIALLLLCVGVNCQSDESSSSSWAKLQISPSELCSMPYGNFRVNIYEHANNNKATTTNAINKKYFYAPIALLNHRSAHSFFNNVTQESEVRFRIEMWNTKVENKVVSYLTKYLNMTIEDNQVQVIPLEKVALVSTKSSTVFSLPTDWLLYQQHQSVKFTLSCFVKKDCDQIAADMRSNPQQFDQFKLLFSLSSQSTQTRQTVIRIDNIVKGQMMTQLMQKFNESTKDALLTASDEKKLLTESTTNVLIDTFDDSDVVSQNSESHVYNMLESLLVSSRTIIRDQSDKMWDSVFWNEDNYRPDKTTKTLNDIYRKLDKEDQKKLINTFQNTNSFEYGAGGSVVGIGSFETRFKTEISRHGSTTKEDINKLFQESKDHGQWDGEKFVPKPLKLSRINLSKLRDTQSLQDRKVNVKYSTAVLSMPIHFVQNSDLTVTDEWQDLKDELKKTQERLSYALKLLVKRRITFENLEKKLNERTSVIADIGHRPTSCDDLRRIGHIKSGFYSVMSQSKIQTVYCYFSRKSNVQNLQNTIGYVDVKSGPVYFYAQKTASYFRVNTIIPFENQQMNVGYAMSYSGIFTAPKPGKYFFSFSAICELKTNCRVNLQMKTKTSDWFKIAQGYGESAFHTLTLQSIIQLNKGDQISSMLREGAINESSNKNNGPFTHFVGWMIEEDIF
ncbi:uncharacterized protein LOC124344330 isoform X2 [Daphnia pulicaria]|uniref:uncharacterized protein LOC124344330 isoform X2 n=2 Tax=Daphnia pulicaria TaxID=35523 RepID=UPI001EEC49CC|nr:uncharacterized protein LOC124344330 isoform X2 [Daphnia pulicaria]